MTERENCEFESIEFFVEQFRLNFCSTALNEVQEEFLAYQLLDESDIPKSVWDDACVVEKEDDEESRNITEWMSFGVTCLQ